MHPPLHNEAALACSEVIDALEECHARGFLWKAVGNCSSAKHKVNMCLRAERLKRTEANREAAAARRAKFKNAIDELGL